MQHPLYTLALHAYRNLSHDPERRAASWCAGYDADAAKLQALGVATDKLERLARAWLCAMGRLASPMITGPARFPVARMEKLNRFERAHAERYTQYLEAVQRPRPVHLTPAQELEAARAKLEAAKAAHAALKATPASTRPWYALPYALRDIKAAQERVEVLEKRQSLPHAESLHLGGTLRLVQDPEAQRFKLFFAGRPDPATIAKLKRAALKWAPSVGAWQRQITPNAAHAIRNLIRELEA